MSGSSGAIRLQPNGSLDTSLLSSTTFITDVVTSLALQSDGKIFIGGALQFSNGTGHYDGYGIIRANSDGTRDWSFLGNGGGPTGRVYAVTTQGSQILVVGNIGGYRSEATLTKAAQFR